MNLSFPLCTQGLPCFDFGYFHILGPFIFSCSWPMLSVLQSPDPCSHSFFAYSFDIFAFSHLHSTSEQSTDETCVAKPQLAPSITASLSRYVTVDTRMEHQTLQFVTKYQHFAFEHNFSIFKLQKLRPVKLLASRPSRS